MPTEINEALTALGAGALVQKVISPDLLEYVRRYAPFLASLPSEHWDSSVYYFNTRNALPVGSAVADGGAVPVSNSNYVQNSFNIALFQVIGSVTGYAQQVTRSQIGDLLRLEMQGATKSLAWTLETNLGWGCAAATATTRPQFDGLDRLVSAFTSANGFQNAIDADGATLTLGYLDQLIDLVESNAAEPIIGDDWEFVMSPRAVSTFSQALIPQQRYETVEVTPGIIVPSYRGVPLVKSSFLSARSQTMNAVTTSVVNTGGALAAAEYFYRVSAVVANYGELNACAEVTATTTGGSGIATLAFTPPTAIDGGAAISYRVFRSSSLSGGGGTGGEQLLGIVDATVGFMADGITPIPTTSIVDNGTALVPMNSSTAPTVTPAAYYGANTGVLPRVAASTGNGGGEDLYLLSRNRQNVIRPYVRNIQPVPVAATVTQPDVLPFAMVTDTCLAMRAPKYAGRLRNIVATLTNQNPTVNTNAV